MSVTEPQVPPAPAVTGSKLPVTVVSVVKQRAATYAVRVAYADGTTGVFLIPTTMATVDGVRISALVMAQLSSISPPVLAPHHPSYARIEPR
jgi:hypothetical protein